MFPIICIIHYFSCKQQRSNRTNIHLFIVFHLLVQPVQNVFHFSVHAVLVRPGTALAPACHPLKVIPPASLTHHWSPTISLTGINAAPVQTCADHGVVDASKVNPFTTVSPNNWYWSLLKHVWTGAADRMRSSPAGDPTFLALRWNWNRVRKTYQVHEPNKWKRNASL